MWCVSGLTSCFIRHFPSSVSSSVGWLGDAVCTESIIMSSSTRANFNKQNNETLIRVKTKQNQLDSFFFPFFYSHHLFPLYLLLAQALFWKYSSQLEKKGEGVLQPYNNSTPQFTLRLREKADQAVVCCILNTSYFFIHPSIKKKIHPHSPMSLLF